MTGDRESFRFKLTNEFEWFFAILALSCVASYFTIGTGGWTIEHAGGNYNLDFKTLALLLCGFIFSIAGLIRLFRARFQNRMAEVFYISVLVLSVLLFLGFTLSFQAFAEAHKSYTLYPPLSGKPPVVSSLYPPYKTVLIVLYSIQTIMALAIIFTAVKLLKKRKRD